MVALAVYQAPHIEHDGKAMTWLIVDLALALWFFISALKAGLP
jgi:hypothetical protein